MRSPAVFARHLGRAVLLLTASALLPEAATRAADVMELGARGVQIYACAAAGEGFAWRFVAPEAVLLDPRGATVGRHFAGPSWQAADGSTVVGEVVGTAGGGGGAIPWLVLRATSHAGAGRFAAVTYVVRSRTIGGVMPTDGCDGGHLGAEARVEYGATYTFFPG